MPNKRWPRQGSMQFWPRKRAKREYARVRSWVKNNEAVPLGFAGYKVGMTHLTITDNRKNASTKGEEITFPVTIVECPPLKVFGIKAYHVDGTNQKSSTHVLAEKHDKNLKKRLVLPKKNSSLSKIADNLNSYNDIMLLVHTQPSLTTIGKKKPEVFELAIGGSSIEEKFNAAKELLGKPLSVDTVFKEAQLVDIHAITKGKGTQGPVKRFGLAIRRHKSEKVKRGPGSLGGWKGHGHFMYRIAHAGQTGYQQRTEYNKWILRISDKPETINKKSGFKRYGVVKNTYVLLKGSIAGPTKRIIRFNHATRPNKKIPTEAPVINYSHTTYVSNRKVEL